MFSYRPYNSKQNVVNLIPLMEKDFYIHVIITIGVF